MQSVAANIDQLARRRETLGLTATPEGLIEHARCEHRRKSRENIGPHPCIVNAKMRSFQEQQRRGAVQLQPSFQGRASADDTLVQRLLASAQ
jgi:hypothetical protein